MDEGRCGWRRVYTGTHLKKTTSRCMTSTAQRWYLRWATFAPTPTPTFVRGSGGQGTWRRATHRRSDAHASSGRGLDEGEALELHAQVVETDVEAVTHPAATSKQASIHKQTHTRQAGVRPCCGCHPYAAATPRRSTHHLEIMSVIMMGLRPHPHHHHPTTRHPTACKRQGCGHGREQGWLPHTSRQHSTQHTQHALLT